MERTIEKTKDEKETEWIEVPKLDVKAFIKGGYVFWASPLYRPEWVESYKNFVRRKDDVWVSHYLFSALILVRLRIIQYTFDFLNNLLTNILPNLILRFVHIQNLVFISEAYPTKNSKTISLFFSQNLNRNNIISKHNLLNFERL
jgi:hypothetical protein